MASLSDVLFLLTGTALGFTLGFALFRKRDDNSLQSHFQEKAAALEEELRAFERDNARLTAEKAALDQRIEQHKSDMGEMERKFTLQFENLANRIFDEKATRFKKDSQDSLGVLLTPLRERLQEFQQKVEDSSKEQFSLKNEIKNIVDMNERMNTQTENLTRALKGDTKMQGNWGEVILEKILEDSGLVRDVNYTLQGTSMGLRHAETGQVLKPDVVIHLPEDKHLIVDSKVSLTAYERYCAAEDDAARAIALKEHLASVRAKVQELEARRYQDTGLGTPDFVLMFMPIEGAYALAMQQDPSLHSYAWDKKVVIVCPSTLFATLRTVNSVWRLEQQNKNADEIAKRGGQLYDKIAAFLEDMQGIGEKIGATQKVYDAAMNKLATGAGNIVKRTQDLQALGAKTSKKLPKGISDDDDAQAALPKIVEK